MPSEINEQGLRLSLRKELDRSLGGRVLGKKHFGVFCDLVADAKGGEIVILDFEGVGGVTASWINSAIVPFYRWAMEPENDLFPLLSAVPTADLDEFHLVAEWRHQCFLHCDATARRARLVGELEQVQRQTLDAVLKCQDVTGAELERISGSGQVRATAWNNRLRDLCKKRLIRARKSGRELRYSPVVKEISSDG